MGATHYRIGGKPAEIVGKILGLSSKATLAKLLDNGDGSYKVSSYASDMYIEISVHTESDVGEPLEYDVTQSDTLSLLPNDFPYRITLARTTILSARAAQDATYGKKRKR